ncbi:MAG: hypothetical protein KAT75_09235, partial [Dehalococcoidia bacterium]|nr:hypothetical protein [Dehalococcoidia bacterium]
LNYATYTNNAWCLFDEVITDSQYLIAGFRLRFDAFALGDSSEEINIDDIVITTDTIPPAAPTGLVATSGNEEISLTWNSNNETDLWGYNVYSSDNSSGPYTQTNGTPVLTNAYTDTVYGGGTYYYVVTAVDLTTNESGYSNEDSATANDVAPAAPTGLVATPGGEQVSLDWNDNVETDLDGYNVYRHTSSGGPYSQINGSLVTTSNYTDTGLSAGVPYYYVVTAVDLGSNESGYSTEDNATPTNAPPAAPTGLVATPGDRQVSLDWNDNSEGDLDGYNVYRSLTSSANYTQINGSLVATSNYNDSTVHGGTTYYYVVTAVDTGVLESGYSNEDSATPLSPTSIDDGFEGTPWDVNWDENGTTSWIQEGNPIHSGSSSTHADTAYSGYLTSDDVDASASTNTTVRFWFYPKALEAGDLLVQTYNGTAYNTWYDLINYPTYTNSAWCEFNESLSDSQYLITGFRLRFDSSALLDGNDNINIDDVMIITDSIPPAAPTNLIATPGDAEVDLDWDDNSEGDLDGYNVYRHTSSGGPYSQINGGLVTTSNYTDTPLYGGGTYYYVVTAVDLGSNE